MLLIPLPLQKFQSASTLAFLSHISTVKMTCSVHIHRNICSRRLCYICIYAAHRHLNSTDRSGSAASEIPMAALCGSMLGKWEESSPIRSLELTFLLFPVQPYSSQHQQNLKIKKKKCISFQEPHFPWDTDH